MAEVKERESRCTWPTWLFIGAMIFAVFTLGLFTPDLDGHWRNAIRGAMQGLVLLAFMGRFLIAHRRSEQNRRWIPYVVIMLLAAPLWLLLEPLFFKLFYFGRDLIHGG